MQMQYAEIAMEIESARLMVYNAARMKVRTLWCSGVLHATGVIDVLSSTGRKQGSLS